LPSLTGEDVLKTLQAYQNHPGICAYGVVTVVEAASKFRDQELMRDVTDVLMRYEPTIQGEIPRNELHSTAIYTVVEALKRACATRDPTIVRTVAQML